MTTPAAERGAGRAAAPLPRPSRALRLLDADPELASLVPAGDRERARHALVAPARRIEAGPFELAALDLPAAAFALLIVEGLVTVDVAVAGEELPELLVTGDVLAASEPAAGSVPTTRTLTALAPTQIAVLDDRFTRAASLWPGLMVAVHRRLCQQQHRLATHGALSKLPRVEDRLLGVLWHLAELVGTVGPAGTVVPLRLTHAELGRLCGARRPTVSLAVGELREQGRLDRRPDGLWLLPRCEDDGGPGGSAALPALAAA